MQRYLDPAMLSSISSLELVARSVVDGFVAGLHRSPDFGFSQEFAEYRVYNPGDDVRQIDWNVFARADKFVLKRYWGETNSQLLVLLDTSASMQFGSEIAARRLTKLDYAKFMAACLVYLASHQRDASGLIVFDEEVAEYVPPSTRQGQLLRLLHTIENASGGKRTDFIKPFVHFQQFLSRRGIVAVISDFYAPPTEIIPRIEPLRYRGNEVILFHVLDPEELEPNFRGPVLLEDMEEGTTIEVAPDYAKHEYRSSIQRHVTELEAEARKAGLGYHLVKTSSPLDYVLRDYLTLRQKRL